MYRLVIIEDQTAIREMLVELLSMEKAFNLVGQFGDGQEALQQCAPLKPDLIILDAKLPSLNGVELLRRLLKLLPKLRVLVFSGSDNAVVIREMLEAGAHGFVEKTAGFKEFRKGLSTVAEGGTYFGPSVSNALRKVIASPNASGPDSLLTEREREVLKLVAEGNSTKEIASTLNISAKTVDNHRTNLMRKLDIHDVARLALYALDLGLIQSHE